MDPPFVRGEELPDEVVLNEELDDLFTQVPGGEGLDGRSLSLDPDEGIVGGQLGHPEVASLVRLLASSYDTQPQKLYRRVAESVPEMPQKHHMKCSRKLPLQLHRNCNRKLPQDSRRNSPGE